MWLFFAIGCVLALVRVVTIRCVGSLCGSGVFVVLLGLVRLVVASIVTGPTRVMNRLMHLSTGPRTTRWVALIRMTRLFLTRVTWPFSPNVLLRLRSMKTTAWWNPRRNLSSLLRRWVWTRGLRVENGLLTSRTGVLAVKVCVSFMCRRTLFDRLFICWLV